MENKIKNLNVKWFEHRQFPKGYGQFPYLILKTGHAIYMQIPIHFNTQGDYVNYPGANIEGISEHELAEYELDKAAPLHDKIMEKCKWIKNKIESDKNKPCRICLVKDPDTAYFFEEEKITFSNTPPFGGTLLTQQNQVIAMNVQHYL